jgi:hypothetical protein
MGALGVDGVFSRCCCEVPCARVRVGLPARDSVVRVGGTSVACQSSCRAHYLGGVHAVRDRSLPTLARAHVRCSCTIRSIVGRSHPTMRRACSAIQPSTSTSTTSARRRRLAACARAPPTPPMTAATATMTRASALPMLMRPVRCSDVDRSCRCARCVFACFVCACPTHGGVCVCVCVQGVVSGTALSVEAHVQRLIAEARDEHNLCRLFPGCVCARVRRLRSLSIDGRHINESL